MLKISFGRIFFAVDGLRKYTYLLFSELIPKLFFVAQENMLSISVFIDAVPLLLSCSIAINKVVSSAYFTMHAFLFMHFKSDTNKENKYSAKMDPCGTPLVTILQVLKEELMRIKIGNFLVNTVHV